MKKLYIGNDNTVVLTCPACDKAKVVDVTSYLHATGPISFTYRFQCDACRCGHSSCKECIRENCSLGHVNTVQLERRQLARKPLSLNGTFLANDQDAVPVHLIDLSRKSVRVAFLGSTRVDDGSKGIVDFVLDDPHKTPIRKTVVVKRCEGSEAVLLFQEDESFSAADKAIGFYLMSNGQ